MATLEKTINGQAYTVESLKAKLIELGVSESKFNDRETFNMPKTGTFYDFEVIPLKNEDGSPRLDKATGKPMTNTKIKFRSSDGEGSISLSRLQAYGKIKQSPEHELLESDVKLSPRTNNYYIAGETLNPQIPSSYEKAILEVVGKKFKCEEVTMFTLPYEFKAVDEADLVKNASTGKGYKITLI